MDNQHAPSGRPLRLVWSQPHPTAIANAVAASAVEASTEHDFAAAWGSSIDNSLVAVGLSSDATREQIVTIAKRSFMEGMDLGKALGAGARVEIFTPGTPAAPARPTLMLISSPPPSPSIA